MYFVTIFDADVLCSKEFSLRPKFFIHVYIYCICFAYKIHDILLNLNKHLQFFSKLQPLKQGVTQTMLCMQNI